MKIQDASEWAAEIFGSCDLGDERRVKRLITYAASQANDPEGSTNRVSAGSDAAAEGAYRLLRNCVVDPKAIDEGAFESVARRCDERRTVLCIQDTSSVEFKHKPLRKMVAEPGCPTGFLVHSALMVDAETREVIGVIDQERWIRDIDRRDDEATAKRGYEEKESYKWEASDERVRRLLKNPKAMITVCDREADIYEYIAAKVDNDERFLVRAKVDRETGSGNSLWAEMASAPVLGQKVVTVSQRGPSDQERKTRPARPARIVTLDIHTKQVFIAAPRASQSDGSLIPINVVYVIETNPPEGSEPLKWRLLTTESIETFEQVLHLVGFYEQRWIIEEFHKCWKTGCRAEDRAFQSFDAVERFLAISCHIAIRILQLHRLAQLSPDASCLAVFDEEELVCLQAIVSDQPSSKSKKVPQAPKTAKEVLVAIARLGGWRDTKNTGRIGWQTLWEGWCRFRESWRGWRLARRQYTNETRNQTFTMDLEM